MTKKIVWALLSATLLAAGGATAAECFKPTTSTPNFSIGQCYDCFAGLRAQGKVVSTKRLGAVRQTGGGAKTAYVIGMKFTNGVETFVPNCIAYARTTPANHALSGCGSGQDDFLYTDANKSVTPVGVCNAATHWYLDSNNW